MNTILISGGSRFIGSHTILQLPAAGAPFRPFIASMVLPASFCESGYASQSRDHEKRYVDAPERGSAGGSLWPYLNTYLAMPLVGTPGVTCSYNNEDFTILHGVMEPVSGQDYTTWVTENVRRMSEFPGWRPGAHVPSRAIASSV